MTKKAVNHTFSPESSVVRDEKGRIVITNAYCQAGHYLMTLEKTFEGHPGIKLIAEYNGEREPIILSPILNDYRKECAEYPEGAKLELLCPVCFEPLMVLAPCGCTPEGMYRTIFLRQNSDIHWAIGICDIFGCPRSFVRDGEDIITEMREKSATTWA